MKISLGSFLLFFSLLAADEFTWSLKSVQKEAYVNEAVALTYRCTFPKNGELFSVELNASGQNSAYRLYKLSELDNEEEGVRTLTYKFVLFPRQSGNVNVALDALILKTNRESIENTILGRDNVNDVYFSLKKHVKLPPLHLFVKETGTTLTGSFSQTLHVDKTSVHAYEPLHLSYTISGKGNMQDILPLQLAFDGVKVFTDAPKKNYLLTQEGFSGSMEQHFTLIPQKPFDIKTVLLEYFDVQRQKKAREYTSTYNIEVSKPVAAKKTLLDQPRESELFEIPRCIFYTLFAFLLGFAIAKSVRFKRKEKAVPTLKEKIRAAHNEKTLLLLLASSKEYCFDELIQALETRQLSLNEAKKQALEIMTL